MLTIATLWQCQIWSNEITTKKLSPSKIICPKVGNFNLVEMFSFLDAIYRQTKLQPTTNSTQKSFHLFKCQECLNCQYFMGLIFFSSLSILCQLANFVWNPPNLFYVIFRNLLVWVSCNLVQTLKSSSFKERSVIMIASKEVERGSKTQKFLHTLGVLAIIFLIEGTV